MSNAPLASVPESICTGEVAVVLPGAVGAAQAYTALLGEPDGDSDSGLWPAGNAAVRVLGLPDVTVGAAFAVVNVERAAALLARRGAPLADSGEAGDGRPGHWMVDVPAVGVVPAPGGAHAGRSRLDHIVFTAPTVDGAVALFAGRLGLDLRLIKEFGAGSQIFFRAGTLVVEVLTGPQAGDEVALWGLAWATDDLDAECRRLAEAGLATSEVKDGRKPGTRVATVREPALGVLTILIEPAPPRR
ncbi:MAG: hypothetical protein QM774_03995 [Gordonia sp. (in: high G+C Gram-positive bacteria)]|uniref:VOC family protein n=1 Tax=Gordonia sp. (in: high G+C Gram-positive bacteria) TaxID=84139 RepID=UPI0039E3E9E4